MTLRSVNAVAVALVLIGLLFQFGDGENGNENEKVVFSSRVVHRFSQEVKKAVEVRVLRNGDGRVLSAWPVKRSSEYYRILLISDLEKQKKNMMMMKLNSSGNITKSRYEMIFPSEGSSTMPLGNDFGWLNYAWIDIGTPSVPFLVALDAGSDLLWVPCDCIQCAPLSASFYSSLDKDLSEYHPSRSSTSKPLPCSHPLCDLGTTCGNPTQSCPYTVNYYSDDTSTSGLLFEDVLHLISGGSSAPGKALQSPVIIGCGSKQSGGYLDGVAPDGLMGLGPGEISVPSFLANAGLIRNSFSLCFDGDESGRIFFGDQGIASQQTTSFLPSDGKYITYIIGVEACCIGSSCLEQTNFRALIDSGTSFTFVPDQVYEKVVREFDRQVNATKSSFNGYPWQYCYEFRSEDSPKVPSMTLKFATNKSFLVHDPVFVIYGSQGATGFCLAIQPTDSDMGTIGHNFMTGYRMVFDRENWKLGWSRSTCKDLSDGSRFPLNPSPNVSYPNPLPTTEQQSSPHGHAVAPALAGRTPSESSSSLIRLISWKIYLAKLLLLGLLNTKLDDLIP